MLLSSVIPYNFEEMVILCLPSKQPAELTFTGNEYLDGEREPTALH